MRRMVYGFMVVAACTNAGVAGQSSAALEIISGPVFVDQGNGFVEADLYTMLNREDRILMKAGGTALLINHKLGCTLSLRAAGLYRVPDMSHCLAGQASVLQSDITITPANGVFVPAEPVFVSTAGGVAASESSLLFGLGFFAVSSLAAVTNTILEDAPVSKH